MMTMRTCVLVLVLTPTSASALQDLVSPAGLAMSPGGDLVLADRGAHRVLRIDPESGRVEPLVGTGEPGFTGDGGPALAATLRNPEWVEYDAEGDLWIADRGNGRIRMVDAESGMIRTVAGDGSMRAAGDGGPAVDASLTLPFGLAIDPAGGVYVFDTEAHVIRRIDRAAGTIRTVIGDGTAGFGGDGGPGLQARLRRPHNGVVAPDGRLIFGDSFNQRIRVWDPVADRIETLAGTGEEGPPAVGGPARESPFTYFGAMILEDDGSLVFTSLDHRIFRIDAASRRIELVAGRGVEGFSGDGGPAAEARFAFPYGLVADDVGNLYVADMGNRAVRRIERASGTIRTLVGGRPSP